MKLTAFFLALWLALAPLAHAAVDQGSVNSAVGWSLAKRAGISLGGAVAGFAAGMGARALLLRALASVALPAFAPALAGVLTVATLTIAGIMVANWAYNAYRASQVQSAAQSPTPAQKAGEDATDDSGPRPIPGAGPGLLGVRPDPALDDFPR